MCHATPFGKLHQRPAFIRCLLDLESECCEMLTSGDHVCSEVRGRDLK